MECNECPPIGALEQGQRKQCMRCVGQCFMKQREEIEGYNILRDIKPFDQTDLLLDTLF